MSTKTTRLGRQVSRRPTPDENIPHMDHLEVGRSRGGSAPSTLKKKRDQTARPRPLVPLGEVIEISSDDGDSAPPPPNYTIANLRRQVKKLREENQKVRCDLVQAQEELSKWKSLPQPSKGQLLVDNSKIEDHTTCDICSTRMWSPHILPECGHAFCQTCLQDWFGSAHAQFMAAHPGYNANLPLYAYHQHQLPRPQYTCPSCREPVKNRPVEDFTLKALVRTLAAATGENSPQRKEPEKLRRGVARPSGPWDGFFPRAG